MVSHAIQLANPSDDPDRPTSAVVFTNVSPLPVSFLVSLQLVRAEQAPAVRLAFKGLHVTVPERTHVVDLRPPATRMRTSVLLYAAAASDDPARVVTAELETPGSACEIQVLSIAAYDA